MNLLQESKVFDNNESIEERYVQDKRNRTINSAEYENIIDTLMATPFPTSWKSRVENKQEMITFPKSSDPNITKFNKSNPPFIPRYDTAV